MARTLSHLCSTIYAHQSRSHAVALDHFLTMTPTIDHTQVYLAEWLGCQAKDNHTQQYMHHFTAPSNSELTPTRTQVYLAEWLGCQVAVKELSSFGGDIRDTKAWQDMQHEVHMLGTYNPTTPASCGACVCNIGNIVLHWQHMAIHFTHSWCCTHNLRLMYHLRASCTSRASHPFCSLRISFASPPICSLRISCASHPICSLRISCASPPFCSLRISCASHTNCAPLPPQVVLAVCLQPPSNDRHARRFWFGLGLTHQFCLTAPSGSWQCAYSPP